MFMVYNPSAGIANGYELTKAAVQVEGQNSGLSIAPANVSVVCRSSGMVKTACPKGSTVEVRAHHELKMLVLGIFYGPLDLVGEARMLIP